MKIFLAQAVVGLVLLIGGRLPISQHRQVKGMIARAIGALAILGAILMLGIAYSGPMLLARFGMDDETATTWSLMAAFTVNGVIVSYIALNLKRWSTIDRTTIPSTDFTAIEGHDKGRTNFDFLNDTPPPAHPTDTD